MSENIYETTIINPKNVDVYSKESMFYVVSKKKFLFLYFGTLGLYAIYWSYRNWKAYKQTTGDNVIPLLRGIFLIFFTHALFRRVNDEIVKGRKEIQWGYQSNATVLVIVILISNALDRASFRSVGSPYTDIASLVILAPLAILFIMAQVAINAACDDPDGKNNSHFTARNYIFLVLGLVWWIFTIVGLSTML